MKVFLVAIVIIFSSILIPSCATFHEQVLNKDLNKNYGLRISSYGTKCIMLCDEILYFESINKENGSKKLIFSHEHDDPHNLEEIPVIIVNSKIAYFWFAEKFAISSDGGKNWNVRSGELNSDYSYDYIQSVQINENGEGKMFLVSYNESEEQNSYTLITNDFGKNWQKP